MPTPHGTKCGTDAYNQPKMPDAPASARPPETEGRLRCCVCHVAEDLNWAAWVAGELESYSVPLKLVGKLNQRREPIFANLRPVRLLEAPEDGEGWDAARRDLGRSDFVVVVCSAASASSEALGRCIRHYKSIGMADRIIAAVIDGMPNGSAAGQHEAECFHPALRHEVDAAGNILEKPAEPLAADFRIEGAHPGWFDIKGLAKALSELGKDRRQVEAICKDQQERLRLMKLKVVAGIIALNLGELTERDKAYAAEQTRMRRWRQARGAAAIALLGGLAFAGVDYFRESMGIASEAARREREALDKERRAAAEKAEIEAKGKMQAEAARIAADRTMGMRLLMGAAGRPGERTRALELLSKAAEAGDALAQLGLANALVDGKKAADGETARGVEWLTRLSAKLGSKESLEAACLLARLNDEGKVIPRNPSRAVQLSEQAANAGHAPAMEQLGYMLERGLGGAGRRAEFPKWYAKAAEAGNAEGSFALYFVYSQGRPAADIKPDPAKAMHHLEMAAKGGSPRALYHIASRLSPEGKVDSLRRSAEGGFLPARRELTRLYIQGAKSPDGKSSLRPNLELGIQQAGLLMDAAADAGNVGLVNETAALLAEHQLLAQCAPIAEPLRRGADLGSAAAAHALAVAVGMRDGKVADAALFARYMLQAAKAGEAQARFAYGKRAIEGQIEGVDARTGAEWIEKAAEQGHAEACLLAAAARAEGRHIEKNWEKAAKYAGVAAARGLPVDWAKYPRRFRPGGAKVGTEPRKPPVARKETVNKEEYERALAITRRAGRVSKAEISAVTAAIPCKRGTPAQDLAQVGSILMKSAQYETALAYLARCAAATGDDDVRRNAMIMLAIYHEQGAPALCYQWRLIAQATSHNEEEEAVLRRLKVGEAQRLAAAKAAAAFLEQSALEAAAEAAGIEPRAAPDGAHTLDYRAANKTEVMNALASAESTARSAEYPEETEEALEKFELALFLQPDLAPALHGAAACALRLPRRQEAFYWALRAALSRPPANQSNFAWSTAVAEMHAKGDGVATDPLEAEKWCLIAKGEIAWSLQNGAAGADRQELLKAGERVEAVMRSLPVANRDAARRRTIENRLALHRSPGPAAGRR